MNGVCPVSTSHNFNSIQFSSIAYSIDLEARRIRKNEVDGETNNIYLYIDYFVQVPVSSNLSDNGKHKILTNQSCLSLNFCHFLFIDSTCNYLGLIIIYLLMCFSRISHNKYNMSLCFSLDKITHNFVIREFFGKTTSSCYITVD